MLATRTKQRGVGEAIQWLAEFPERKASHERTNHLHSFCQDEKTKLPAEML